MSLTFVLVIGCKITVMTSLGVGFLITLIFLTTIGKARRLNRRVKCTIIVWMAIMVVLNPEIVSSGVAVILLDGLEDVLPDLGRKPVVEGTLELLVWH